MAQEDKINIRNIVRRRYANIASQNNHNQDSCSSSCCSSVSNSQEKEAISDIFTYSREELSDIPEKALMGLGCGNPGAIADIKPGETVLDLGSGGGIDCFIASKMTGNTGFVIGVDMTPDMLETARKNAKDNGYKNIDFRLGEIEHLPVADNSVDVIISNCVINLSPDKRKVYSEAYRVLKRGGRLAISDMVAVKPLPESVTNNVDLYASCIAGAVFIDELATIINESGFNDTEIEFKDQDISSSNDCAKGTALEGIVRSANIKAIRR